MHVLIVGMTDSGKSTLARALCAQYKRQGYGTLVLDPGLEPGWQCDFITRDRDEFLRRYWHADTEGCMVFFDESSVTIGQHDKGMQHPATMGRKKGHINHFICQRLEQISPNVRGMCSELYLFRCSKSDARTLADHFYCDALLEAGTLAMPKDGTNRGAEYFHLRGGGECLRKNLFTIGAKNHATRTVSDDRGRGNVGSRNGDETGRERERGSANSASAENEEKGRRTGSDDSN